MTLYNIRKGPAGFCITKFTDDLNVEASYNVNSKTCNCPAGFRPTCRHRKMLPRMLAHVGDSWFYDYEHQNWHRPIEDRAEEEPIEEFHAGEGPEPSTIAATALPSPSVSGRGQPAPIGRVTRR